MSIRKFLILALFMPSMACLANDHGISDDVYLTGGVCTDETFAIMQATANQANFESFTFSKECKILGVDRSHIDAAPTGFVCYAGGKTALAGATYKKIKNSIIKSDDEMQVDTRVYIYKCIKACGKSPIKIKYSVGDCG